MADRKATIELVITKSGSITIDQVSKSFDAVGKTADKSAKKVNSSWDKVKTRMKGAISSIASGFTTLAAKTAESVTSAIAFTTISRKMNQVMDENQATIKENTSAWSKLKKSIVNATDTVVGKIKGFAKSIFSFKGIIATLAGTAGVGALVKSFVGVASKVEDFKTRLISLTKSEVLAAQKLKQLSDFASKAPFQLPEIIEAGITLEAFGAKIKNTIKPVGDLAAFMGVTVVDAAKSFGRAFAAGAGAADVLRERGVLAMVKLKAGVKDLSKLTLPEFRKVLLETMTDPGGKISGATKRLAKTFSGQLSMMSDSVFNLKRILGSALMPAIQNIITKRIKPLVKEMSKWVKINQKIIEQRFDQIVTGIANAIEGLVKNIGKAVSSTRQWWKENKELIITFGQLYVAVKAAGIIIGVMLKVAVAVKVLAFAKAIGLLTASTTLLTGVVWLLKPALASVAAGVALLIGFKVGTWLSDWITGMGKAREATRDLEINTERLQKKISKKLTALEFSGLVEFNEAVKKGIKTYNKVSKTWEKVKESVNMSLDDMAEKVKGSTDKITGTWDKMGKKLKESFEALDLFPKAKLDSQAKSLIDAFKTIVKEAGLSNDELFTARSALFDKLKNLNEKAEKTPFPVGFDSQTTKQEVERVFDEATGTATFKIKDMAEKLKAPSKQVGDTIFAGMASGSDKFTKVLEESADTLTITIKKQALDIDRFISETVLDAQDMFGSLSASIQDLDTEIPVSVIDNATPVIKEIQFELEALHDKTITVTTRHINLFTSHDEDNSPGLNPPGLANGLDLVPYDMNVRVHKNERIQRADENPFNPSAGQVNTDNRQSNNTFNFAGQVPTNQMDTEDMMNKALRKTQGRVF